MNTTTAMIPVGKHQVPAEVVAAIEKALAE
jgi:hypothetical protein